MLQFLRQHWLYLLGALLLHVLFAGIFALTLFKMSWDAPPPQLAIQAVIVDESMLASAPRRQQPDRSRELERLRAEQREKELAEKRRLEEEVVQREAEQRAERERQAEQQRREEEEQRRVAEEQQLRSRQEEQRRQEAEAEAEKKKQAEAERQRQAEAERKRVEEIKRKQEEEAQKRRAAEEARAQAAREEELQRQLEEEEGVMEARGSTAMAQYVAIIRQHVERRWIRPPSAREDLECEVRVVQAPGGAVLSAQVTRCNGDTAVRQSIETAVMRSSPLPPPPDPRLFERTLVLVFKPAN